LVHLIMLLPEHSYQYTSPVVVTSKVHCFTAYTALLAKMSCLVVIAFDDGRTNGCVLKLYIMCSH